jgi:predicted secreted Zn-dependent protease
MNRLSTSILIITAGSVAPDAFAQQPSAFANIPNVNIEYYDVSGVSPDEINASLEAKALTTSEGRKAYGGTQYAFNYTFRQSTTKPCKISQAGVEFRARVILPRLTNEAAVPGDILRRWRAFMAGLEIHEAGHARLAFAQSLKIVAAIEASPCGAEREGAWTAISAIKPLQQAYDLETQHGITQGAELR